MTIGVGIHDVKFANAKPKKKQGQDLLTADNTKNRKRSKKSVAENVKKSTGLSS